MNAKRRGGANKRQPLNFLNPEHVERERGQQKVHVWELRNGRSRNPRTPKEQRERMRGQSILQLDPWRGGQVEKHNLAHGPEPWPVTCSNDSKIILTGLCFTSFPWRFGPDRVCLLGPVPNWTHRVSIQGPMQKCRFGLLPDDK